MKTGFIGWRGMVGSVLLQRMREEGDFAGLQPTFFSTSAVGGAGPDVGAGPTVLADAWDLDALALHDVIVCCQGGDFTRATISDLRESGWTGIWIDAASTLRMDPDAVLCLDPVNRATIHSALDAGYKTFVGANCTVSLLLMGLIGLLRTGRVQWINFASYQAASGGGARKVKELVEQFAHLGDVGKTPHGSVLDLDAAVAAAMVDSRFPMSEFGAPLAGSALPWIDRRKSTGQTKEEWKSMAEGNKLLDIQGSPLPIDGVCVRIGAMRCHAQAVMLKLDQALPLHEVEALIAHAHPWVDVVPNTQEDTLARLTPAATAGSLQVAVGRIRTMAMGPEYISLFTVGDQLLWGAAEPLRRMLQIVRNRR
ncbi:MAG: aspartate-semialdehyde dehydrogenase [Myxococcota bacterium]